MIMFRFVVIYIIPVLYKHGNGLLLVKIPVRKFPVDVCMLYPICSNLLVDKLTGCFIPSYDLPASF